MLTYTKCLFSGTIDAVEIDSIHKSIKYFLIQQWLPSVEYQIPSTDTKSLATLLSSFTTEYFSDDNYRRAYLNEEILINGFKQFQTGINIDNKPSYSFYLFKIIIMMSPFRYLLATKYYNVTTYDKIEKLAKNYITEFNKVKQEPYKYFNDVTYEDVTNVFIEMVFVTWFQNKLQPITSELGINTGPDFILDGIDRKILSNLITDILYGFLFDEIEDSTLQAFGLPDYEVPNFMKNNLTELYLGCPLFTKKEIELEFEEPFILENELYRYIYKTMIKTVMKLYTSFKPEKEQYDIDDIDKNRTLIYLYKEEILENFFFKYLPDPIDLTDNNLNTDIFNLEEVNEIYKKYQMPHKDPYTGSYGNESTRAEILIDVGFKPLDNLTYEQRPYYFNLALLNLKLNMNPYKVMTSNKLHDQYIEWKVKENIKLYIETYIMLKLLDDLEEDDPIVNNEYDKNNLVKDKFRTEENVYNIIETLRYFDFRSIPDTTPDADISVWGYKDDNTNPIKDHIKVEKKQRLKYILENMLNTFKEYHFINNDLKDFDFYQFYFYRDIMDKIIKLQIFLYSEKTHPEYTSQIPYSEHPEYTIPKLLVKLNKMYEDIP